jgi:DNA-binding NarL/FixJ family response regulator
MANRKRTRVLIADDHRLVAEGCERMLEAEFDVVGVVFDGRAVIEFARKLRPDVVVLDISMPQCNGLDAGEQIKNQNSSTKIVYLTMHTEPEIVAEAFRRGGSGYVLKQSDAEELAIALRKVIRGESYLAPSITSDTMDFLLRSTTTPPEPKRLSPRRREILQLLVEGNSMKEIAWILKLKPGTVAFHKYQIMNFLGIDTTAGLVEYAIRNHMIAE